MKQAMCEYNFNENSTFFQLNVLFNANFVQFSHYITCNKP